MTNFIPAKGAEILLQLHGEFQPGLKYCFPGKKSIRMSKLDFQPGLKFRFDYMGFFLIFKPVCPG